MPTLPKKRKIAHAVEEINFDTDARQEYLTGFHKRKLQRIKRAQEESAKREKQEKLDSRKQVWRSICLPGLAPSLCENDQSFG